MENKPSFFARVGAFVNNNLSYISKLFINHIGMCVFGLMVLIAADMLTDKIKSSAVFHIMGALAILMYMCLLYTAMWEKGASDKIKIDGGRLKKNKLRGLYIWTVANTASILFAVLINILNLIPGAEGAYGAFVIIDNFYNGMYLSIIKIIKSPLVYFIILIPGLITATVSYILGVSGYRCLFPEPKNEKNSKLQ